MSVKTYSAHSMQAAMAQVKEDLGDDALIISTRRLPKPPRDPYGKDLFQIEAALPAGMTETPLEGMFNSGHAFNKARSVKIPKRSVKRKVPEKQESKTDVYDNHENIRDLFCWSRFSDDTQELMGGDKEALNVYFRLITSGLSERRARFFLRKAKEADDSSELIVRVMKEIVESLETWNPFNDSKRSGPVHAAFVGPTGVGKTTTIAKLAAYIGLKQKKKVGLVSVDNYRIGGVDQLKTYSAIIGLPCIPAFSTEDLKKALSKLAGMDVVLIDSAGQSHLDSKRMAAMKTMIESVPSIETHLVVNASMERIDMSETVESFSVLSPVSYVFSKVDETKRMGRLIDQMLDHQLPLSFITNGQEVPEDLVLASKKQVLNLLLDPESFRKRAF